MDPFTHAVIGITISKLIGNDVSIADGATVGIVIGAISPDIDIVCQKWGDYVYLKNHRGITHSILSLVVLSSLIGFTLSGIYGQSNFISMFFWAFLGGLSHLAFDILNPYGAKVLWPFLKKKFSLGLLIAFDPMFLITLGGFVLMNGKVKWIFMLLFLLYLTSRVIMRLSISKELSNKYGAISKKISIIPSLKGLFKWQFVLQNSDCDIIGEKNLLRRKTMIVKTLQKIEEEFLVNALLSHVGEFFAEFTPVFHVVREKAEGVTRYIFIDMRYYIKNGFLHHAILEVNDNKDIVYASFNPYSINRVNIIPNPQTKRQGYGIFSNSWYLKR